MLVTGHTPAVRSGRTRALGLFQPCGMVRLHYLHAHRASIKRRDLLPQPGSTDWSSAGLQGSIGFLVAQAQAHMLLLRNGCMRVMWARRDMQGCASALRKFLHGD